MLSNRTVYRFIKPSLNSYEATVFVEGKSDRDFYSRFFSTRYETLGPYVFSPQKGLKLKIAAVGLSDSVQEHFLRSNNSTKTKGNTFQVIDAVNDYKSNNGKVFGIVDRDLNDSVNKESDYIVVTDACDMESQLLWCNPFPFKGLQDWHYKTQAQKAYVSAYKHGIVRNAQSEVQSALVFDERVSRLFAALSGLRKSKGAILCSVSCGEYNWEAALENAMDYTNIVSKQERTIIYNKYMNRFINTKQLQDLNKDADSMIAEPGWPRDLFDETGKRNATFLEYWKKTNGHDIEAFLEHYIGLPFKNKIENDFEDFELLWSTPFGQKIRHIIDQSWLF